MEAKHTKGPWQAIERGNTLHWWVIQDEGGHKVAEMARSGKNAEANARLIAAAPDQLAANIAAYALLADITHEWRGRNTEAGQWLLVSLREAICKATGRDAEEVQDEASIPAKATATQPTND